MPEKFLARQKTNMTQQQFAALLGISKFHLSRMEGGHAPVTPTIERLADAVVLAWHGDPAAYLFTLLQTPTTPKAARTRAKR